MGIETVSGILTAKASKMLAFSGFLMRNKLENNHTIRI
jgi:hypothetical protein